MYTSISPLIEPHTLPGGERARVFTGRVHGDVVVAPAGSAHRFLNPGPGELRLTAIHTAPEMQTEWL